LVTGGFELKPIKMFVGSTTAKSYRNPYVLVLRSQPFNSCKRQNFGAKWRQKFGYNSAAD